MDNVFQYAQPMIPSGLMHEMYELKKTGGSYDYKNGGQWVSGDEEQTDLHHWGNE